MENDKRNYKRDEYFFSDVKISLDGDVWHDAKVFDISANGLKFQSNIMFDSGDDLWFNLSIPEFLSKREMKIKGRIRRKDQEDNMYIYGVSFEDLSPDIQIGIDENIMLRNRISKKKKEYSD